LASTSTCASSTAFPAASSTSTAPCARASTAPWTAQQVSTDDQAALLAIVGGAKLYVHLLTSRMSVTAASGIRIPHTKLRRLEDAGLVARDTGHRVHAGQLVALTDAGRAALFAARRTPTTQTPKVPARPGTSPPTPAQRR
jgi:hypothetical protein